MLRQTWGKRLARIMVNLIAIITITGLSISGFGMHVQSVQAEGVEASVADASGVALFETNCAGCHPKGGNIIKRGKTLKLKPLTRRHLDSVEAIATFVTNGKGLMSAYGDILTPEEIETVSRYVWKQAQSDWKPLN